MSLQRNIGFALLGIATLMLGIMGYKKGWFGKISKPSGSKLTQAEADAIAKKYQDFKNSGNAEILIFPSPSQNLMIQLNEAGYYLMITALGVTTKDKPAPISCSAVYKGGIVHQLGGYKYSDGSYLEDKKNETKSKTLYDFNKIITKANYLEVKQEAEKYFGKTIYIGWTIAGLPYLSLSDQSKIQS